MIGGVAFHGRALVARFVIGIGTLQCSQAYGRQQFTLDDADDGLLLAALQQTEGQANREDLIRAKLGDGTLGSQDVIETLPLGVPEERAKTVADVSGAGAVFRRG